MKTATGEVEVWTICPHGAEVDSRQSRHSRVRSRAAASILKIGIISDTHGLVRAEAIRSLRGVDHIIHAGDIGHPEVISD